MGITINGSSAAGNIDLGTNGTITDLAVGGLPDGTVDADTLASGTVGGATGTDYNDNVKVRFGTGNDLELYHSGDHSFIKDVGQGNLAICGSKIEFLNAAVDEVGISFIQDGSVSVYHNGSKKAETSSTGFDVTGFVNLVNNNTGLKTTAGNLKLYSTTGQIGFQTDANHVILAEATDSTGYTNGLLQSYCHRTTTNGTYNLAHFYNGNFGGQFKVADSGNCTNSNNSYGSTSDERLKQDIVDAASQWNDIKGLRVRKFRWKAAPTAPLSIGLVAQEAETVSPGLVENTGVDEQDSDGHAIPKFDADGNRETVKTLKYSVLYMKAIKCLQEAQARIETLETKVAALEAG